MSEKINFAQQALDTYAKAIGVSLSENAKAVFIGAVEEAIAASKGADCQPSESAEDFKKRCESRPLSAEGVDPVERSLIEAAFRVMPKALLIDLSKALAEIVFALKDGTLTFNDIPPNSVELIRISMYGVVKSTKKYATNL